MLIYIIIILFLPETYKLSFNMYLNLHCIIIGLKLVWQKGLNAVNKWDRSLDWYFMFLSPQIMNRHFLFQRSPIP